MNGWRGRGGWGRGTWHCLGSFLPAQRARGSAGRAPFPPTLALRAVTGWACCLPLSWAPGGWSSIIRAQLPPPWGGGAAL